MLLGRRHARAGFLPDIYVFPGGRVEPGDGRGLPLPLAPPVAAGLAWASRRPAAAFVRAALRETAEESGLSLAPEAVAGIDFICRAITPTRSHRRYNTRFLLADGACCQGVARRATASWRIWAGTGIPRSGRLNLVDVTTFVLEEAVRRWRLALAPGAEPAVRFSYAGGRVRIFRRPLA